MLGANALSELGTMLPRSGGQYVFVRHALGDYAGFIVGWSDWISTCGTTAAVAIVVGEYAIHLAPHLRAVEVVALAVIAIFTLVQWLGVRWGGWAQDVTSLLKALAFPFLIAACFLLGNCNPAATSMVAEREGSLFLAYVLALQAVIDTYDGWSAVVYFSEELKEPDRNIPRAMFGGIITVIAIYLLVNVAFLRVVPLRPRRCGNRRDSLRAAPRRVGGSLRSAFGFWRGLADEAVARYLDCGIPELGFARLRCDSCRREGLLTFSCRTRELCPSCGEARIRTSVPAENRRNEYAASPYQFQLLQSVVVNSGNAENLAASSTSTTAP